MKTGQFIQTQYDREIKRIKSEITLAMEQVAQEQEIVQLQKQLQLHAHHAEGAFQVHLNCSGVVCLQFRDDSRNNNVVVGDKLDARAFGCLEHMHLKELKSIHPKRTGEMLRYLAKREMLVTEGTEKTTKKWWQFWK